MYQCDWFGDYQNINRLHLVFQRISRRFSKSELFINAENEIIKNLKDIEELFHLFYRRLVPSHNKRNDKLIVTTQKVFALL